MAAFALSSDSNITSSVTTRSVSVGWCDTVGLQLHCGSDRMSQLFLSTGTGSIGMRDREYAPSFSLYTHL